MCGICGFSGSQDRALLERMAHRLAHRGPDSQGFHESEGISLGMRRLSIIDLFTGAQPMHNEDRKIWVVFNGEIYNYRQLRAELSAKGHKFLSNSDTEVLVHLYEEYGDKSPSYLHGMFAYALWDENKRGLFIARDQLGIKPLYYALHGGKFSFASELKALLCSPELPREADPCAIDSYLTFLNIPAPDSIFKSVKKLPAGHALLFSDGRLTLKRYWDVPSGAGVSRLPQEEQKRRFAELFDETVKAHMISDVPLGVFLSGGIDSCSIAAAMSRVSGARIKTFSIG
ncbi:MAG TPA: asparagine synthase (glutamine-hydrolyzing), partial [Elusimicrobiales bacterium]|nr:asparagine synthase (glutamine-hydrolyzing) [Elusimicrobiales bacterium]